MLDLCFFIRGGEASAHEEVTVFIVHLLSLAPSLQFQSIKEDARPQSTTNPREVNKGEERYVIIFLPFSLRGILNLLKDDYKQYHNSI